MDAVITFNERRHLGDSVLGVVLGARFELGSNTVQSSAVFVQVCGSAVVVAPYQHQQWAEVDAVFDTAFELAIELGVFGFQIASHGTGIAPPEIHRSYICIKGTISATHIPPYRRSAGL